MQMERVFSIFQLLRQSTQHSQPREKVYFGLQFQRVESIVYQLQVTHRWWPEVERKKRDRIRDASSKACPQWPSSFHGSHLLSHVHLDTHQWTNSAMSITLPWSNHPPEALPLSIWNFWGTLCIQIIAPSPSYVSCSSHKEGYVWSQTLFPRLPEEDNSCRDASYCITEQEHRRKHWSNLHWKGRSPIFAEHNFSMSFYLLNTW